MNKLALSFAVLGAVGAARLCTRDQHPPKADVRASASLPDVAYRYRFEPRASAPIDISERIASLETKIATQPSAIDLAELGEMYAQRAQQSADPEDLARATAAAERSLALLPSPNSARLTLAKIANMRHEFRDAVAHTRAYLTSGDSPNAYLTLATAHLALGELEAAVTAADTAVDARPRTSAYLMRALVLEAQGRDAEAEADFERAVVVEDFGDVDESARLRALWGRFLVRRGQYERAQQVLVEAVRIVPAMPLAVAQQGELALRQGHPRDAIRMFDRAFAGGRELRYLMDRARAEQLAGDAKAAASTRAQVETLVRGELATTGLGHRLDLVETLVDRGRPADLTEAIALAREEVTHRGSAETLVQLARAFARAGSWHQAGTEIRKALALGGHDARAYELAARIETKLGNTSRGALYAAEAAKLDPANAGWRSLGMP